MNNLIERLIFRLRHAVIGVAQMFSSRINLSADFTSATQFNRTGALTLYPQTGSGEASGAPGMPVPGNPKQDKIYDRDLADQRIRQNNRAGDSYSQYLAIKAGTTILRLIGKNSASDAWLGKETEMKTEFVCETTTPETVFLFSDFTGILSYHTNDEKERDPEYAAPPGFAKIRLSNGRIYARLVDANEDINSSAYDAQAYNRAENSPEYQRAKGAIMPFQKNIIVAKIRFDNGSRSGTFTETVRITINGTDYPLGTRTRTNAIALTKRFTLSIYRNLSEAYDRRDLRMLTAVFKQV